MILNRDYIVKMQQVAVDRGTRDNILNIESFTLSQGELVAVVGPNGAGKSTLLQIINMLHDWRGEIQLFGQDIRHADKTRLRRRSAMVFQEMLLLNDTVFNNVAVALKFRGIAQSELTQRVYKALQDFHCDHLAARSAHTLSGGETQRVCIARALVTDPELLLLDEPFAALDTATRVEMIEEIRELAKSRGIAVILVSHNFTDVLHFAERAVAMFNGRIVQDDKPELLMRRPVNQQVARLVGMDNIIPCRLEQQDQEHFIKLTQDIRFLYEGEVREPTIACCLPGDAFCLYQENFFSQQGSWVVIEGLVERIIPGVGSYCIQVKVGQNILRVRLPRNQVKDKKNDASIKLAFKISDAHLV